MSLGSVELKKVYTLLEGSTHIGDWDLSEIEVVTNQKEIDIARDNGLDEIPEPIIETIICNPIPEGTTMVEKEMQFIEGSGWKDMSYIQPQSQDDYILNLEFRVTFLELGI